MSYHFLARQFDAKFVGQLQKQSFPINVKIIGTYSARDIKHGGDRYPSFITQSIKQQEIQQQNDSIQTASIIVNVTISAMPRSIKKKTGWNLKEPRRALLFVFLQIIWVEIYMYISFEQTPYCFWYKYVFSR